MSKWDIFAGSDIKRYPLARPLTHSLEGERKSVERVLQS